MDCELKVQEELIQLVKAPILRLLEFIMIYCSKIVYALLTVLEPL